jgi:hypothetical protein
MPVAPSSATIAQQIFYPFASLRSRYPELCQMRPQGIEHLGTLAHQQILSKLLERSGANTFNYSRRVPVSMGST